MNIYKKNDIALDNALLASLAEGLKLPQSFVELLLLRGLNSEEKIRQYLNPAENELHNPFDFDSMQAVVDRIKQAQSNHEKVVVYCDYDADGICAGAILSLFLASLGIEVSTYVPSRSGDGYGLHIESLDRIIEENTPDLIITCDCGISCATEVEHVLDLGVDIIITDHHEIPEKIPDCVVLNPRIDGCGYPFECLCGAGVAFKIAQAFLGEKGAEEYLDMAAVATIADLVPLFGENRLIVQRGLKQLEKRTNLGLSRLLERLEVQQLTSTDVAFKIAPRINAAGRMGEASRAFRLLTSADITEIDAILDEIEADNMLRKEVCETLYEEACADLQFENLAKRRSIVLSYPDWEKGITGIVAARLAGEFKRPTFIMVKNGDHYKGAARGIQGISVHKMLVFAAHLFIEYGGHEQAAGFSISEGNIAEFSRLMEEYLRDYADEYYLPSFSYDLEVTEGQLDRDFVRALDMMEPFGHGNPRPLFLLNTTIESVTPCKNSPAHTQVVTGGGFSLIAFNFAKKNQILLGGGQKKLVVEAQISSFGAVRGVLRQASSDELFVKDDLARAGFLRTLGYGCSVCDSSTHDSQNEKKTTPKLYKPAELEGLIDENIFGTLLIAGCKDTYLDFLERFAEKAILREFIYSTAKNNYTRVIISPDLSSDLSLSLYNRIIFLDAPLSDGFVAHLAKITKAEIYLPEKSSCKSFFEGITASREVFAQYYEVIKNNPTPAPTLYSYYYRLGAGLDICQFMICLLVFTELKLVTTNQNGCFSITVNKGKKVDLADSQLYQMLQSKLEIPVV